MVLSAGRITLSIMGLEDGVTAYSSATVDKDIREFFRAERKRLALKQEDVAEKGGIEQSTISKIERDPPYDPGINSFLRAIRGLNMRPSEFFARFERRTGSTSENIERSQNQVLLSNEAAADTDAIPITLKAAHHGGGPIPAASISEDDLRAFFRILQRIYGGSILEAIGRVDAPRKRDPATRDRKPGSRKSSRRSS